MSDPAFVHLRVHSEYSVSDSIVRIDALVDAAAADRQPAVAITDLSNLFGWIKLYKAARAVGVKPARILFRHLLPNAISPAIVLFARDVGGMVILDAAFAFFKLGGTVEWGQLLALNRSWILGTGGNPLTYWWVYLPFTLALVVYGVAWGMLGESLNSALNPRENNR